MDGSFIFLGRSIGATFEANFTGSGFAMNSAKFPPESNMTIPFGSSP